MFQDWWKCLSFFFDIRVAIYYLLTSYYFRFFDVKLICVIFLWTQAFYCLIIVLLFWKNVQYYFKAGQYQLATLRLPSKNNSPQKQMNQKFYSRKPCIVLTGLCKEENENLNKLRKDFVVTLSETGISKEEITRNTDILHRI